MVDALVKILLDRASGQAAKYLRNLPEYAQEAAQDRVACAYQRTGSRYTLDVDLRAAHFRRAVPRKHARINYGFTVNIDFR